MSVVSSIFSSPKTPSAPPPPVIVQNPTPVAEDDEKKKNRAAARRKQLQVLAERVQTNYASTSGSFLGSTSLGGSSNTKTLLG
jgi:hypothetical protein